jgi:natural product biosynthesis luciferase-like monooxygenase protein
MEANKFSCYVIGGDSLLIQCAEILLDGGHDLKAIITSNPRIERWARERKVAVVAADAEYKAALAREPFDYLFAITHLSILPDDVISLPRRAAINFHDGPLPHYAGLYTPAWALIQREASYGITWHVMTPGIDEGDLLKERRFELAAGETSLTVNTKCFELGIESFGELVGELAAGTSQRRTQDRSQRKYYGKHQRPDAACTLRWSQSAADIDALVRALDFGQYENPLGLAKLAHGGRVYGVARCRIEEPASPAPPGTLIGFDEEQLRIATADGAIALSGFSTPAGEPVAAKAIVAELALVPGTLLNVLDADVAERLTKLNRDLVRSEGNWQRRLARLDPLEIPYASGEGARGAEARASFELPVPDALLAKLGQMAPADAATVAVAAFLARLGGKPRFDVAFSDAQLRASVAGLTPWVATVVPMRVDAPADADLLNLGDKLSAELAKLRRWGTYLLDAIARKPELRARPELRAGSALPVAIVQGTASDAAADARGALVAFAIAGDGRRCVCSYDPQALRPREAAALQGQLTAYLADLAQRPDAPLASLSLLSAADRKRILNDWNQTGVDYRRDACVHELVQEQVERTPDAVALAFERDQLTYRELNARANRLAHYLRGLGVGPDKLVGVYIERSLDLIVAILAVQKAGGAYVPLDPAYPRDRLAFMIEDSGVAVLLTQAALEGQLPPHAARVVRVDADPKIAEQPDGNPQSGVRPENLAYVIYTSGSTGKPKGVMVEHRNVANFFSGMDPVIAHEPPGTWFAVTSLSFDISVLELFWTLARGFKLVVFLDRERGADPAAVVRGPQRKLDFSIFMWGADDQVSANKYDLMLKAARFADERGFSAMWTPERHFHAFGGPYPNPSVTGAAIAAVTSRIQVRAGSCVVPLHHPARVAEEWAVVDNISRGRVGISFASGWQPDDFLLRPESFKESKRIMAESIEQVRRLWRGEKLSFMGPLGKPVEILTQPRPVQKELPYWVTTAGSPETYRLAGAMGANVLTHLLGQTVEEVGEKIRVYRKAREDAGFDPATGIVSLMLHTFVGENVDEVRELVREPMKSYLRSSVTLIKNFAWAFPAFKRPKGQEAKPEDIDLNSLTVEELDAILEFAFERYFETSGLFGTVETCLAMLDRVRAAGVDDIACLIDFGVPTAKVTAALEHLAAVRSRANEGVAEAGAAGEDLSLPGQFARHGVTHMQCTPSMARMLLMSDTGRKALRSLKHLMIGGEAFPVALARELTGLSGPTVTNMYGPTETTIWSSTHRVQPAAESIPIGRPIANTQMYVLDGGLAPVPVGVPGELFIAGDGVVRGYLNRPELTAERFVRDPHAARQAARMYRTGDVARFRDDGAIEFLGRSDHQVKIRGYRIELGEIETALNQQPAVREGVVVAREDTPGDQRLVAYLVPEGKEPSSGDLRDALRAKLPEYMVPAHFVVLDKLPLTPNGKIDRKALPAPDAVAPRAEAQYVAPESDLEQAIVDAWRETLGVQKVGVRDNFFDLGGHSLLVVRLHRRLQPVVPRPLSITDLYRFPTIASLAEHLTAEPGSSGIDRSEDRAKLRLEMRNRRRRGRDA